MASKAAVVYKFRDRNTKMVEAWAKFFKDHGERVKISQGDIFKDAPAADALVSPANSFGDMDGGIDRVYCHHFGWQLQTRLQEKIRQEFDGELLVGQATIIPTFEGGAKSDSMEWDGFNEDQPIKYLISAPTMRVPLEIPDTVNVYLTFRAVVLAVQKFNQANPQDPITSVLCPGLGTAIGQVPHNRAARQMLEAFSAYELGEKEFLIRPETLGEVWNHHINMTQFT